MINALPDFQGASVRADGVLLDATGHVTALRVENGGHTLIDEHGRALATITRNGRVYDRNNAFIAQIERHDV
jgi:hypothetical protein